MELSTSAVAKSPASDLTFCTAVTAGSLAPAANMMMLFLLPLMTGSALRVGAGRTGGGSTLAMRCGGGLRSGLAAGGVEGCAAAKSSRSDMLPTGADSAGFTVAAGAVCFFAVCTATGGVTMGGVAIGGGKAAGSLGAAAASAVGCGAMCRANR